MEEWDLFLSTMRESLPATFRITGTRLLAESVRACLEKRFFSELSGLQVEGEEVPPPEPLPWWVADQPVEGGFAHLQAQFSETYMKHEFM